MIKFSTLLSLVFVFLVSIATVSAQQAVWKKNYISSFGISDVGKEIHPDPFGNVYVGAHSFINSQGNAVSTIIKYDSQGNRLWDYHSIDDSWYMEDMLVDGNGFVYYAGAKWQDTSAEWDFLLVKIDPSGNDVWTRTYDGNGIGAGSDYGWSVSLDKNGFLYMTGHSQGTFNGYDFLTTKYDTAGNFYWARNYPNPHNSGMQSSYENDAFEAAADDAGNVYVSGYMFNGVTDELTLVKYDAAGNFIWTQVFPTGIEWGTADINKNFMRLAGDKIYLVGNIVDSISCDIMILKYDSSGALLWKRQWDSPNHDSDYVCAEFTTDEGMQIDANENIYIAGVTANANVQFSQDILTLKYDSAGNFNWANAFDGAGDEDESKGIALDNMGNVYVCGSSYTSPALSDQDYVTFRLNGQTGVSEWVEYHNGPTDWIDEASAIAADQSGSVYVTGYAMKNADPTDAKFLITTIKYAMSPLSINYNETAAAVHIYPNPSKGNLYVNSPTEAILRISDISGKLVYIKRVVPGITLIRLDLSPGIYVCQSGNSTAKIVITE